MTIYSVFNYHNGLYGYYEGPGEVPTSGHFRAPRGLGGLPESLAVALPSSARYVGAGEEPKGVIAVKDDDGYFGLNILTGAAWGLIGYLVYRTIRNSK